jgi:hypothetical protein
MIAVELAVEMALLKPTMSATGKVGAANSIRWYSTSSPPKHRLGYCEGMTLGLARDPVQNRACGYNQPNCEMAIAIGARTE